LVAFIAVIFVVVDYGNNVVWKIWERKKYWLKGEGDTWTRENIFKDEFRNWYCLPRRPHGRETV